MALSSNQLDLIKLYMASFNRPPEKGGFDYWTAQIAGGKTFAQVVDTVFSLDIVKEIYPDNLPNDAFLTLIYINIFNKIPDDEGLAYWMKQLATGKARSGLVMDMINAGLGTPDGTPGKAFIVNRYEVSQHAVEQQIAKNTEISISTLKKILTTVTDDAATVTSGNAAIDSDNAGGLGPPKFVISVPAAVNGINPAEKTAGVSVVVDLTGTNAAIGNTLEILINGVAFSTPVTRALVAADITSQKVTVVIPSLAGWGTDGSKVLSARVKDGAGHIGTTGGDTTAVLDTTAPGAPTKPLTVDAAADGINVTEKLSGVAVNVDLTGTNAAVGDTVTLLIGGLGFATPVTRVLTLDDITAQRATLTVGNAAGWGIDGTKVLTARLTDAAGNVGTAGGNVSVVLDTTAAAITSVLAIAAASNGINAAEKKAGMDVVVNLSGATVAAGDTIDVLIDGLPFTTALTHVLTAAEVTAKAVTLKIAADDTAWGADGSKVLTARIKDVAGNLGSAGGSLTVKLDTVGPTAPTNALSVVSGDISTAKKAAGIAVTMDLTGTGAAAGDIVSLLIDDAAFSTPVTKVLTAGDITAHTVIVTIPGTAAWGADGSKVLSARVNDAAGNEGTAGGKLTVQLKTTAPGAPTSPITVAAAANGISAAEKAAGVDAVVSLAGTGAVAGDSVALLNGGLAFTTPITAVLSAADITAGTATLTIASAAGWGIDGNKILTARVTDSAGNVGIAGGALTVGLDTTAPGIPTLVTLTPVGGTVVTNSLNGTNTHLTAKANIVAGQATGGSAVLKIGGVVVATDASILAGDTSVTFTTSDGSPTNAELQAAVAVGGIATVTLTDAAGNSSTSAATGPLLTVNYTGPGIPNNSVTVAAGDISSAEKTAGVAVVVSLAGTGAVAGDKVALLLNGAPFTIPVSRVLIASDINAQSTTLTIGSTAGWGLDGSKTLTAVVIDTAGNTSVPNAGLTLNLDTVAPTAPSNVIAVVAAANGISNAEKTAGVDVVVDLAGTGAAAGDTVAILIGGVAFATPVTYTLTGGDITAGSAMLTIAGTSGWGTDGSKILSARLTDFAGNNGTAGGNLTVTLDTISPSAPTNAVAVSAATNGISSAEIAAGVAVVVNLTGTNAVAGNTLEVTLGGAAFSTPMTHVLTAGEITAKSATVTIASSAGWGADGTKTLGARVIDTAGNIGNPGGSLGVTVDTTAATALGSPVFVNVAGSASAYDPTDVVKLFLNESIAVASIGVLTAGGSGTANLDTSTVAAFNAVGGFATQFDVTLNGGALSMVSGDTITLVGIDAAGNQANVTWTLV